MPTLQNQIKWSCRAQWTLATAIALLLGGFFLLGYRPQTQRLGTLREQIAQNQRDLSADRDQTKILPRVQSEVEVLRARLARYKALPKQQELPQFLKDVFQLGQQASLKRFDLKPGVPVRDPDQRYNELPLRLTFDGDFVNVYSFLRHTEELQRLTRVRAMNVRGKDRGGLVKVDVTMNIYFAGE
ncbi:MAG TPA: type 4a pilus biogenesis protein PilO [Tepidisphaeraceae bacterium]|jgi:Tfp pilus assembly protein PilO